MTLIPHQNLAVDLLILSFDKLHNHVKIFTPVRGDSHKKALPGVLVKEMESIEEAVHRTLHKQILIEILVDRSFLFQFWYY